MTTKEVFAIDGGFGYKILIDGKARIIQEHKPAVSGNQFMTEVEANKLADLVIVKMSDVMTEDERKELEVLLAKSDKIEVDIKRTQGLSNKGNPSLSCEEVNGIN